MEVFRGGKVEEVVAVRLDSGDDVQVLQLFSVDKKFILTILYYRTRFYNIEEE